MTCESELHRWSGTGSAHSRLFAICPPGVVRDFQVHPEPYRLARRLHTAPGLYYKDSIEQGGPIVAHEQPTSTQRRLSLSHQLPSRTIQRISQPQHRIKARITQAALHQANVRRMAGRLVGQGFLRHLGSQPSPADNQAKLFCSGVLAHTETLVAGDYCLNRQ